MSKMKKFNFKHFLAKLGMIFLNNFSCIHNTYVTHFCNGFCLNGCYNITLKMLKKLFLQSLKHVKSTFLGCELYNKS